MIAFHRSEADRGASTEQANGPYALICGVFVAAIGAPGVAGAIVEVVDGGAAVAFLATVGAVMTLVASVSWLVMRGRSVPVRLGGSSFVWAFAILALLAFAAYLALGVTETIPSALAFLGVVTSAGGGLIGVQLVRMSRTRHARAVVEATDVQAEWTAGWPESRAKRVQYTFGASLLVAPPAMLLGQFYGIDWLHLLGIVGLWIGIGLGRLGHERTYRVTPAGLERASQWSRRLYGWEGFIGYRDGDDALIVGRQRPWQLAFRCDWTEIDDPAAVRVALSQHLDRQETAT